MEDLNNIKDALKNFDFSAFPEATIHLGSAGVWLAFNDEPWIFGLDRGGDVVKMSYPNTPDLVV